MNSWKHLKKREIDRMFHAVMWSAVTNKIARVTEHNQSASIKFQNIAFNYVIEN